jgi:hypothetical protein
MEEDGKKDLVALEKTRFVFGESEKNGFFTQWI